MTGMTRILVVNLGAGTAMGTAMGTMEFDGHFDVSGNDANTQRLAASTAHD